MTAATDRVEVWTDQHPTVLDRLHRDGLLRADGRRVPLMMRPAFKWLRNEMLSRVPGSSGRPLIWLNAFPLFRRRDICDWSCVRRGAICSKVHTTPGKSWLRLSLPTTRVLLSDFELWDRHVIRYAYVPKDLEDLHRWQRRVRRVLKLPRYATFPSVDDSWPKPLLNELQSSWTRVFDVVADRPTQGTVEYLLAEDVIEVVTATAIEAVPLPYRNLTSPYRSVRTNRPYGSK